MTVDPRAACVLFFGPANGKIRRELGLSFRPARESVLAAVEDVIRWGHV